MLAASNTAKPMDLRVDLGTSLGTAWRFRKRYLTITNLDIVAERGPAVALLSQAKTSRAPPASRQVMLRGDRPRSRNAAAEPTRALPGIPPSLRPLTISDRQRSNYPMRWLIIGIRDRRSAETERIRQFPFRCGVTFWAPADRCTLWVVTTSGSERNCSWLSV